MDTRTKIIKSAVQEIQIGMNVNLGIGMPALLVYEIPNELHVLLHPKMGCLASDLIQLKGWKT